LKRAKRQEAKAMAIKKRKVSKKRQRIENLIERLKKNDEVSLRDFRNAISKEEFQDYENTIEMRRDYATSVGSGSTGYNDFFKKGLFFFNRGEGCAGKNPKLSSKYHQKAQACFEKALQELESDFRANPSIADDYDRNILGFDFSLDPIAMPRLRSSKSLDNQSLGFDRIGKRQIKLQFLKTALEHAMQEELRECESKETEKKVRANSKEKSDPLQMLEKRLSQSNARAKLNSADRIKKKKKAAVGAKSSNKVKKGRSENGLNAVHKVRSNLFPTTNDKLAKLLKKLRDDNGSSN
jgi:hypothetical protein